jgi:hypothetical protein
MGLDIGAVAQQKKESLIREYWLIRPKWSCSMTKYIGFELCTTIPAPIQKNKNIYGRDTKLSCDKPSASKVSKC